MRKTLFLGTIFCLALPLVGLGAADIPAWLAQAALGEVGDHPAETEAVFLLDERVVTVRDTGTIRAACRVALRVLRPGGIDEARRLVAASGFDTRILSMKGWGVTEGRKTAKVTVKDVIETGLVPDILFADISVKILNVPGVEVGSIIDYRYKLVPDRRGVRSSQRSEDALEDVMGVSDRPREGGIDSDTGVLFFTVDVWDVQADLFTRKAKFAFVPSTELERYYARQGKWMQLN